MHLHHFVANFKTSVGRETLRHGTIHRRVWVLLVDLGHCVAEEEASGLELGDEISILELNVLDYCRLSI